jgi:hypothetical protein
VKYDEIRGDTVYLSAGLDDGFANRLVGKIEIFIPTNASVAPDPSNNISSLYQTYNYRYTTLNNRYLALTIEQQSESGVGSLLSQAKNYLDDMLECSVYSEAQSIASDLDELYR